MKQQEIVNEIHRTCGKSLRVPLLGWCFWHKGQAYCYVTGKDVSMVRFCIPYVKGVSAHDLGQLQEVVNETNRNVKYIKATLSVKGNAKVSLNYDHKTTEHETAHDIVPHIIQTLEFAARYLVEKLKVKEV